jgi:hypothetical protein
MINRQSWIRNSVRDGFHELCHYMFVACGLLFPLKLEIKS